MRRRRLSPRGVIRPCIYHLLEQVLLLEAHTACSHGICHIRQRYRVLFQRHALKSRRTLRPRNTRSVRSLRHQSSALMTTAVVHSKDAEVAPFDEVVGIVVQVFNFFHVFLYSLDRLFRLY